MGVDRLKLLIQNHSTGKIEVRRGCKAELLKSMAWLKRMNAKGNDILVQPDEAHGLVLVGELTKNTLESMSDKGFAPAVSIEAPRGVFQAWVKLTTHPVSKQALAMASEGLAQRFSAAAGTASYLAGFTVHRGQSETGAHPRYALAHEGQQRGVSAGPEYFAKVEQALREQMQRFRSRGRDQGLSR